MAGKEELAREVMEFYTDRQNQEVRFLDQASFSKIIGVLSNPMHLLLCWLAWDIGENINSLLQLQKRDCRRIIPNVLALITGAKSRQQLLLFTKFFNREGSGYTKWIGWHRLMGPPETDLVCELDAYDKEAYEKTGYSSFTPEIQTILSERSIQRIVLCGIATDGCVLKTAVDAFERGIEPIVVSDACYSHAGESVHQAGLLLMSRFIGKRQMRTTREVLWEES